MYTYMYTHTPIYVSIYLYIWRWQMGGWVAARKGNHVSHNHRNRHLNSCGYIQQLSKRSPPLDTGKQAVNWTGRCLSRVNFLQFDSESNVANWKNVSLFLKTSSEMWILSHSLSFNLEKGRVWTPSPGLCGPLYLIVPLAFYYLFLYLPDLG